MKTIILILSGISLVGIVGFGLSRQKQVGNTSTQPMTSAAESMQETQFESNHTSTHDRENDSIASLASTRSHSPEPNTTRAAGTGTTARISPTQWFNQALESLVSPQASYEQKQQAWQQLRAGGKLDLAITELEQRTAANPSLSELPATLGQAYLQKAGSIQDVREQGILGMKADQTFDTALNIDSSNWEARFWKATAMSYWPSQLNKGKEVIEHFLECVKIQEGQAPSPQFVQTYVLLGEQYQKQGYGEFANQTWRRGLSYFPNDPNLQNKLSPEQ